MVTASSWSPSNGPTKHIVHVILLSLEFSEQSDVQRFDPEEFDRLYEARVASEATAAGQQRPGHPRRRASDDSARLAHADEAKERRPRRRSLFGNNGSQGALHPAARRRDSTGSAHSNRSEAETVTVTPATHVNHELQASTLIAEPQPIARPCRPCC